MMKKIRLLLACMVLFFGITNIFALIASAADGTCNEYSGSNVNSQNYYNYDNTIKSYLTSDGNGGLMRIQADAVSSKILIEYYDTSYNFKSSKTINNELPIFGAFYETTSNYYILSGQINSEESDSVEVFRLTKYDKNWKKKSSCSLYGANTYIPFDAGSARITTSGKYMLIRTAHEMYMSDDGYHHQANVTIQVDMDNMKITDYFTDVMNSSYGYVSHSFNQFIKTEGNNIIAVDHGDAYPRSIVLIKYNTDFTTGSFVPDYYYDDGCTTVDMMVFPGSIGQNYTGATIGGFEISDSSYIVAGNATEQTNNFYGNTRNVFVAVASRDTGKGIGTPTIKWITSYAEGKESTNTPHLVKISNSKFILLWSQGEKVYYTQLDGKGNKVGSIYSIEGALSDCVPYQLNGKIIWYTWDDEMMTFYEINTSNLATKSKVVIENGHKFTTTSPAKGSNLAKQVCKTCGYGQSITVPTSYDVWWSINDEGVYYSSPSGNYYENDIIKVMVSTDYCLDNRDIVVKVSDTSIATIDNNRYGSIREIKMKKAGNFTITIYPRYNTNLKTTYNIKVSHKGNKLKVVKPTCTAKGYTEYKCEICKNVYKSDYVDKLIDLSDATVTIGQPSFAYTGNYIKPVVTVKVKVDGKTKTLTNWEDYKVNYKNYKNPGTATITVEGRGKYAGKKSITFTIRPVNLSNATVTINQPSFGYTGKYIKPVVTVKVTLNGKKVTLTNWEDYSVAYKNYRNPGVATITVKGRGITTGSKSITFQIRPSQVKNVKISGKSTTYVNLKWDSCVGVTGYEVYRATTKNGTYSKVATVTAASYKNTGLKRGKTYYYKVRAYKTVGNTKIYGSYSGVYQVATK